MKIGELVLRTLVVSLRVLGEVDVILTNPYTYAYSLPYSDKQVEDAIRRLVSGGDLKREGRGARAVYRLTERGEERVRERMSRFLTEPVVWDGKWRLVIFDIEETQRVTRDQLRRFLKSVGFGRLQLSIWISPFPVREILGEFLEKSGLSRAAMVLEADYLSGLENREVATRVWGLAELSRRYLSFAYACGHSKRSNVALREEFAKLVVAEPFLPDALLPDDYGREPAFRAYNDLLEKFTELYTIVRR